MKRLYRTFLFWLMQTRFYSWLLLSVIPYIRFTTYYTSLNGAAYHRGYRLLKPGHIILCVDRKKLTTFLVPGQMTHAALCINRRDIKFGLFEVAEMTHHNYTHSNFFDICKESDRVVIMSCDGWDEAYLHAVIKACVVDLHNATYDVAFDLGIKSLYCSEMVYQSDRLASKALGVEPRLKVDLSDLAGLGRPYISPDGLLFADNVRCVWDSDGKWDALTGPSIEALVTNSP